VIPSTPIRQPACACRCHWKPSLCKPASCATQFEQLPVDVNSREAPIIPSPWRDGKISPCERCAPPGQCGGESRIENGRVTKVEVYFASEAAIAADASVDDADPRVAAASAIAPTLSTAMAAAPRSIASFNPHAVAAAPIRSAIKPCNK
jgi:hypothetical protein